MRRLAAITLLLVVVGLPAAGTSAPDVSVDVSAEPSVVNVGGRVSYRVEIHVNGRKPIAVSGRPKFGRAFKVVGRTTSPRTIYKNGSVRRSRILSFRLRARKTGTHTIEPPRVQVGGDRVSLEASTVRVVESKSGSSRSPKRDDSGGRRRGRDSGDPIELVAEVEPNRSPYLGEQITLTYRLITVPNRLSVNPHAPDIPTLDAFWIENLSRKVAGQSRMKKIDGRFMRTTILRAYALFPLETGSITIEPMRVDVRLRGPAAPNRVKQVESDPVELEVEPLPDGAPSNFYEGNVGDWSFRVHSDASSAERGGAVNVKLAVDGTGNVGRLRVPPCDGFDGFELANRSEDIDKEISPSAIEGRKVVTCTLVPKRTGELTVPSLEFSYFDPADASYHTESSEPLMFTIREPSDPRRGNGADGRDAASSSDDSGASDDPDTRERLRSELAGPIRNPASVRGTRLTAGERVAFGIGAGLPLVGLLLLWVAPALRARMRGLRDRRESRESTSRARRSFERIAEAPGDFDADDLHRTWKRYCTERLGLGSGRVRGDDIREALEGCSVEDSVAGEVADILGRCEESRYSPTFELDAEALRELASRSEETLRALESAVDGESASRPPTGTSSAVVLVAAAAATFALGPDAARASDGPDSKSTWQRGVEHHDAGEWEAAVEAWRASVAGGGASPAARYNFGTALAHTGDLGGARLHLERAALLAPGDNRIADNLRLVRRLVDMERTRRATGDAAPTKLEFGLDWWKFAAGTPVRPAWIGGIVALWLVFLGMLGRRLGSGPWLRTAATSSVALGLAGALLAGGWWASLDWARSSADPVVVTGDEPPTVRTGPSDHAPAIRPEYPLVPGTMLRPREHRSDWLRVRVDDDPSAWLRTEATEPVGR